MIDEYANMNIDSYEEEDREMDTGKPVNNKAPDMIRGQKVIQLKTNFIPRGLVPLERLFDLNDVPLFVEITSRACQQVKESSTCRVYHENKGKSAFIIAHSLIHE